jgi:rhodanese-related sulfurtransferase
MLIDVRTQGEFGEGHPAEAVNIPVDELATKPLEVSKEEEIVLCCRSGVRAQLAQNILMQRGYQHVSLLNLLHYVYRAHGFINLFIFLCPIIAQH